MPIPPSRRRTYLARQVGSLALSQVRVGSPMAPLRAAAWANAVARAGLYLPLFVVHDLGVLLTVPPGAGGWTFAGRGASAWGDRAGELEPLVEPYRALLRMIAGSEVTEKAAAWRLRDELVAAILTRLLVDVHHAWPHRRAAAAEELPLDPGLYADADVAAHFLDFDDLPLRSFLGALAARAWHVYTCLEGIDLDTLRLLGFFREAESAGAAGADLVDLVDLLRVLRSPEANDIADFSLELLPSVLETTRSSGAQTFAVDGYATLERQGPLEALVPSELAHDDDVFDARLLDHDLTYYAHEKQREEERSLHMILVDASASMRGERQVFGRGLALALAKKLALGGDEVWLRFFDSRLHDVVRTARAGQAWVPYVLGFRSEHGRNAGRVFRQLAVELDRLRRGARRRIVLHVITHGQCHIPVELAADLRRGAALHAVIILPSSAVALDWLPHFDRHHIVTAEALRSRPARRERALGIVDDAAHAGRARRG